MRKSFPRKSRLPTIKVSVQEKVNRTSLTTHLCQTKFEGERKKIYETFDIFCHKKLPYAS